MLICSLSCILLNFLIFQVVFGSSLLPKIGEIIDQKVNTLNLMTSAMMPQTKFQRACNAQSEWKCDSGQCIELKNKCNGVLNCYDNSDEKADHCIAQRDCTINLFRCSYGACISRQKVCNGNWDCVDGSDEVIALCSPQKVLDLQGNCRSITQFQCLSGECISLNFVCDGRKHCRDESDEVVHVCATRSCTGLEFRCGYGACISVNLKCNGVADCFDGSDEASSLCSQPDRRTTFNILQPSRNLTSTTTTITSRPPKIPTSIAPSVKCQIKTQDKNILIKHLESRLSVGQLVALNTIIEFSCVTGYVLEGEKSLLCTSKGWNDVFPKCLKYCNREDIVLGVSTRARCIFEGEEVECNDRIRPGSVAHISCAYGFQLDSSAHFPETLNCLENGEWDTQKASCNMKCGQVVQEVTKFSIGGSKTHIKEAPWQVAIYSSYNERQFNYRCAGAIIGPSIVISAAHCFWDERNKKLLDPTWFRITAGKTFRNFSRYEPNAEYRNISKILIHNEYGDLENNFVYDMAVLVLEKSLPFSYSIYPLCNPRLDNAEQYVESNITGFFAGWGITKNGLLADELQCVAMNTLSFSDCQSFVQERETSYVLASDKFCVYDPWNIRSACKGDSGSAFVVSQTTDEIQTFRLVGVISHTPTRQLDCAEYGLVTVTNVQFLRGLIQLSLKDSRVIDARFEPNH